MRAFHFYQAFTFPLFSSAMPFLEIPSSRSLSDPKMSNYSSSNLTDNLQPDICGGEKRRTKKALLNSYLLFPQNLSAKTLICILKSVYKCDWDM